MTTVIDPPVESMPAAGEDPRRTLRSRPGLSDRLFRGVSTAAGATVLAIMLLVGAFLSIRAGSALSVARWSFFSTQAWEPDSHDFGIAAVLPGTLLIGGVAIMFAIPLATGTALFISEYAARWFKGLLIRLIDLMAAVPSVVYGLWGFFWLQHYAVGVSRWLATWLGWFPPFAVHTYDPDDPLASLTDFTSSTFIAGMVVALMVTPIICAIMREVFTQAPQGEREAAYALGATRWGMIRTVVLPYGRGGMIGGAMLGLGRALGETIAVYLIISPATELQPYILQRGANSISALIALRYGAETTFGVSALMAAGLTLFLLTLVVNFLASIIIQRSRSGASSEG